MACSAVGTRLELLLRVLVSATEHLRWSCNEATTLRKIKGKGAENTLFRSLDGNENAEVVLPRVRRRLECDDDGGHDGCF